jgi:hypothetical protein
MSDSLPGVGDRAAEGHFTVLRLDGLAGGQIDHRHHRDKRLMSGLGGRPASEPPPLS